MNEEQIFLYDAGDGNALIGTREQLAVVHLEARFSSNRRPDQVWLSQYLRATGHRKPEDIVTAIKEYAAIAQDLRRQLDEQLAKRGGMVQGELF